MNPEKGMSHTREINMAVEKINPGHKLKNEVATWQFVEQLLLTSAEERNIGLELGAREVSAFWDEGEYLALAARDWEQQ